jgi:hypothetical protein
MVDGAARESSVLTLSHWPQSPTPPALARDVSAAIVFAYLTAVAAWNSGDPLPGRLRSAAPALAAAAPAECVTNDHFDEDGVLSVFGLVNPGRMLDTAELIVDAACCGDFGVVRHDIAAQVSFAIAPMAEAEAGAGAGTSACYEAVLPLVAELLDHPARFERYWRTEAEELDIGRAALASGDVEVVEHRHRRLDLAVVRRLGPAVTVARRVRVAGASGGLPIHAAAVHSVTQASRILAFDGEWCELYFRYEGWVRFASRPIPLRPDLAPLGLALSAEEPSGVPWEANGVGAIIGRLRPGTDGRTEIDPRRIERVVEDYLAHEAPAWDPWRPGGGYIPEPERAGYVSPRPKRRR